MKQRYFSLDVFRGATVALMILVNNPGSWSHIYAPLAHAPWHGCTPTDLVFPFFLFAVGNALAFVMPNFDAKTKLAIIYKILKRTALIFLIGLLLNWSPFVAWSGDQLMFRHWVDPNNPDSGIRILGVLQRIAICYGLGALFIYIFKVKGAFLVSAVLLLGYWAACVIGNPTDPYSINGWFGTAIDKSVLGVAHMYKGEGFPFEPEGLMSSLPSIAQVIFGYFVGQYIISSSKTEHPGHNYRMLTHLLLGGVILIAAGYIWDYSFPINKKIWTSSYVLYTTGLATTVLSVLIYFIEFRGSTGWWSRFFVVFGKNPLFIFVLSALLVKSLALFRWVDHRNEKAEPVFTSPLLWFYQHVCKPLGDLTQNPKNGSLFYAVCLLAFMWVIVWWMDKKKIYLKV